MYDGVMGRGSPYRFVVETCSIRIELSRVQQKPRMVGQGINSERTTSPGTISVHGRAGICLVITNLPPGALNEQTQLLPNCPNWVP